MLRGLFARRAGRTDEAREACARVKALAQAWLPPGTDVTVNEIICTDPSCPGAETVVLAMRAGERTRAAKVPKPAAEAGEQDVRAALVAAGFGEAAGFREAAGLGGAE